MPNFYDRKKAIAYAHKWAFSRNPVYYNFDAIGGDCTNFISQCIYAGAGVMNFTKDTGWYYRSLNDRAAAWTSVEYLHKFLINNTNKGPFAKELPLENAEEGDVIQLSFDGQKFSHSLYVVEKSNNVNNILIATHTFDSDYRRLDSYIFKKARLLHISGVR